MDTLSHGIWGAIFFGRNGKKKYRGYFWAAFFGILPDAVPFSAYLPLVLAGTIDFNTSFLEVPGVALSYRITHSFITAGAALVFLFFFKKKLLVPFLAWPLHIVMDIFTHTTEHSPTLFLYPLSDFHLSFIYWRKEPLLIFFNYLTIALVLFYLLRRKAKAGPRHDPRFKSPPR